MPKKIASILILLISTLYAHSQKIKEADSTYILSYADKFVVKLNVDTQTDTYSLTNIQDGSQLRIAPNNNYRLFLSLDTSFWA
ncbi:hypothetical protein [Muriicola sp.]|uniref:hypothetical protein n=1 Tax=Muriicola sp. TaxID=2020856 RepID=UPI003C72A636